MIPFQDLHAPVSWAFHRQEAGDRQDFGPSHRELSRQRILPTTELFNSAGLVHMTSPVGLLPARQPVPEHPNLARYEIRSGKTRQQLIGLSWLDSSADGVRRRKKGESNCLVP